MSEPYIKVMIARRTLINPRGGGPMTLEYYCYLWTDDRGLPTALKVETYNADTYEMHTSTMFSLDEFSKILADRLLKVEKREAVSE